MTTILELLLSFPCELVPFVGGEAGPVTVGGDGEGVGSGTGV